MEFSIKLKPKASQDIDKTIEYYTNISIELGFRFYSEIRTAIESLKIFPRYQVRYGSIRCLGVDNFPYLVHYKIDEDIKEILIIAVIHTSRDPKRYWKIKI